MAKNDHEESTRIERLLEGVQDALLATERQNALRHIELVEAIRERIDVLGKLHRLNNRLARIARVLRALDAST